MQKLLIDKAPPFRSAVFWVFARSVFKWWWQGFSDLIPGYKRLTTQTKKPIILMADYQHTTVISPSDPPTADSSTGDRQLPSLFDECTEESLNTLKNLCLGHFVEISLAPQDVLLLDMTLPKTAQFKLKEAVAFKLITESPLDRTSVYFDTQIKEDQATQQLITTVALCSRDKVNHLLSVFKKADINTVTVGYSNALAYALDFVFYTSPGLASARLRLKKQLILLASLVMIPITFLPIIFFTASWMDRDIRQDIKSIQQTLDTHSQLLARRAQIGAIKSDLNNQIPPHRMTSMLNDLAAALPKTAWITAVRYDNGLLQLTGNSPNIVDMMKELNKLSTIGHVKLISVAKSNSTNAPSQFEVAIDSQR